MSEEQSHTGVGRDPADLELVGLHSSEPEKHYRRPELQIFHATRDVLEKEPVLDLKLLNFGIKNGDVYLEGEAPSGYQAQRVEERVAALSGVDRVINDIKVPSR